MVKALADSTGAERTYAETLAEPDYALEDHWRDGELQERLRRGGWDYVVMQQGPSALPESRTNLLQWVATLSAEIRRAGAEPVMYMVWPSTDRSFDFYRVSESYRLAAESVSGLLAPAGEAWRAAWRRDPSLLLYGPDGFHPSVRGTYAAALAIYATLYRRPATGLPAGLTIPGGSFRLSDPEAALLQAAADEAVGTLRSLSTFDPRP